MGIQTSIFIKSWKQDLHWLDYCLRFLECNWLGAETEFVVVLDQDCRDEFDPHQYALDLNLYYALAWPDGYSHAMYQKTIADRYTLGDYIVLLDSDTMLLEPGDLRDLTDDTGRPIIPFIFYEEHEALYPHSPWRKIRERLMQARAGKHYMSRMPILYWRTTFPGLRSHLEKLHGRCYEELVYSGVAFEPANFSEHPISLIDYDLLGAYAFKYENRIYQFKHELLLSDSPFHQYHSWSQNPESLDLSRMLQKAFTRRLGEFGRHQVEPG
jgi:hypothetical protein